MKNKSLIKILRIIYSRYFISNKYKNKSNSEIKVDKFVFEPNILYVDSGETVEWIFKQTHHNVKFIKHGFPIEFEGLEEKFRIESNKKFE